MKREKAFRSALFSRLGIILIVFLTALLVTGCSKTSSGGSGDGSSISDQDLALSGERWGEGNIPQASADGPFRDILFAYDSAEISPEFLERLKQDSKMLVNDSSVHAEIEGHCDKRGTNEYNLALGEERARSVARLLVSYGVRKEQLSTISYGEEIPLDPGDNEAAYAKNRRVHFALYRMKGGQTVR